MILEIIRSSLWNDQSEDLAVTEEDYYEMQAQAIAGLPAGILSQLSMSGDLKQAWNMERLKQLSWYTRYTYEQARLPLTVPYVILKGSAAAQYYPHPEFRTMGDIDIMPRREDYKATCDMLLAAGYKENAYTDAAESTRHREFAKNGVSVEVHAYFATMNDVEKVRRFDDLILENINPSHVLPDRINGLVLLEHINQHLEHGLGLRQIIDWMMFVDRCLPDEKWQEFQTNARETGLEVLAITTTRMCEMYLGLSRRQWCSGADETLCAELLDYVFACGNFGRKMSKEDFIAVSRLSKIRHPVILLREYQKRGVQNWDGARNPLLRPFAWLSEFIRYARKTGGLTQDYDNARKINRMLDELGVKREAKGLVSYENGVYVKK